MRPRDDHCPARLARLKHARRVAAVLRRNDAIGRCRGCGADADEPCHCEPPEPLAAKVVELRPKWSGLSDWLTHNETRRASR